MQNPIYLLDRSGKEYACTVFFDSHSELQHREVLSAELIPGGAFFERGENPMTKNYCDGIIDKMR